MTNRTGGRVRKRSYRGQEADAEKRASRPPTGGAAASTPPGDSYPPALAEPAAKAEPVIRAVCSQPEAAYPPMDHPLEEFNGEGSAANAPIADLFAGASNIACDAVLGIPTRGDNGLTVNANARLSQPPVRSEKLGPSAPGPPGTRTPSAKKPPTGSERRLAQESVFIHTLTGTAIASSRTDGGSPPRTPVRSGSDSAALLKRRRMMLQRASASPLGVMASTAAAKAGQPGHPTSWSPGGTTPTGSPDSGQRRAASSVAAARAATGPSSANLLIPAALCNVSDTVAPVTRDVEMDADADSSERINALKQKLRASERQCTLNAEMAEHVMTEVKGLRQRVVDLKEALEARQYEVDALKLRLARGRGQSGEDGGDRHDDRATSGVGSSDGTATGTGAPVPRCSVKRNALGRTRQGTHHKGILNNVISELGNDRLTDRLRDEATVQMRLLEGFRARQNAILTRIVSDLTQADDGGQQHSWNPAPFVVAESNGRGTILHHLPAVEGDGLTQGRELGAGSSSVRTVAPVVEVWKVPENPLNSCLLSITGGAMYSTHELFLAGGQSGGSGIQMLLSRVLRETEVITHYGGSPHAAALPSEAALKTAGTSLVCREGIQRYFNTSIVKRASERKRTLLRSFTGFAFPRCDPLRHAKKMSSRSVRSVAFTLGGGKVGTEMHGIYSRWKESRGEAKFLFGGWRRLTVQDMNAAIHACYEKDSFVPRGGPAGGRNHDDSDSDIRTNLKEDPFEVNEDRWNSIAVPASLGEEAGDYLFRNSHSSQALVGFTGRHMDSKQRKMRGNSSILQIARADAWFAAYFSIVVDPKALASTGISANARHNEVFKELLPQAVLSLMRELRTAFTTLTPDRVSELEKPFDPRSLRSLVSKEVPLAQSDLAKSMAELSRDKLVEVGTALDNDTSSNFTSDIHRGNPYSHRCREHTVVYHHEDENMDFLMLTPAYVKNRICPWMGDVCDAYIGTCTADEQKFGEIRMPVSATEVEDDDSDSDTVGGAVADIGISAGKHTGMDTEQANSQ